MPDTNVDAQKKGDKNDQKQSNDDQEKGNQEKDGQRDDTKPAPRWPFVLGGLVVLAFIVIVLYQIFAPTPNVWTNDAYVRVHYAMISPRISGHVLTVQVDDNQEVKAGQVLVTLDPRQYYAAVAEAVGALQRDQAQEANTAANVNRQPSLIREEQASVASAKAQLALAQYNAKRYLTLAPSGAVTKQQLQQADTTLLQAQATLESNQASLQAAQHEMKVLQAMRLAAHGTVNADDASLYQARLNLSYTRIVAPLDGMVGERSVQVGNYVSPGSTLMTVVPLGRAYITANYREVALRHVRPGQSVDIHVDAYNINLKGVVNSVPPATGATFSPIPPSNATGNFTKIVQRLPVKITLTPGQKQARLLRDGFSVETTIHTHLAQQP